MTNRRILFQLTADEQERIKGKRYSHVKPIPDTPPIYITTPSSKRWVFDRDMSDEFEGAQLDLNKWAEHNRTWKGRAPGWFSRDNVKIYQGAHTNALYLESREEKQRPQGYPDNYGDFSTAFVGTHKARKYGYFEIVCRLMDSRVSSAFWFSNPSRRIWTELDVFEYSASDKPTNHGTPLNRIFATNYHIHKHPHRNQIGKLKEPKWFDIGFDLSQQRIKVGLNWQEDKIQWFINDYMIREEKNEYFHQPLHLQLDSETFPKWFGLPEIGPGNNNLPSSFRIMYVRSWYLDDQDGDDDEVEQCNEMDEKDIELIKQ